MITLLHEVTREDHQYRYNLHPSIYPIRPAPFHLPNTPLTLPFTLYDLHPSIYPLCIRRVTIYVSLSANRTQPIVLSTIQQRKQ